MESFGGLGVRMVRFDKQNYTKEYSSRQLVEERNWMCKRLRVMNLSTVTTDA